MKFSLFYEKFAMGVSVDETYSDVYINPDDNDRLEMIGNDKYASFRAILAPNGDLYAWVDKGSVIHRDVLFKLGLSFNRGAIALYIHPEDKYNILISYQKTVSDQEKNETRKLVQSNKNLENFLKEPISIRNIDIQERQIDTKKLAGETKEVKLYTEPTDKEIQSLLQVTPSGIRGGVGTDGKIYAWKLDVDPRDIVRNFNLNLIAELLWDAQNRKEIMIRFLSPKQNVKEIDPVFQKKMEDELIFAFPFLDRYYFNNYAGKEFITKELK